MTFVLGLLLFARQYEAADHWLYNSSWLRMSADTAVPVSVG
jgi:hypothetical protein